MNGGIYLSTSVFRGNILMPGGGLEDGLRKIEFSGGDYIGYEKTVEGIERLLKKGVESLLIHNYFPIPEKSFVLNFASGNPDVLDRTFALAGRALDLCARFGIPYYSFHPGYLDDGYERRDGHFGFSSGRFVPYREALGKFRENLPRLLEMARARGVGLAVENLFPAPGNVRTSLNCSMEEVDELVMGLPEEVGVLVDLGHLNITAHYLETDRRLFVDFLLSRFSHRIYELHLSGNDGAADDHLPLLPGDWQLEALKAFSLCPGFSGEGVNITLEARKLDWDTLRETRALIESHL